MGDKSVGAGATSISISGIPWFTRWGETDWYDIHFEELTAKQIYNLVYECTQNNLYSMYKLQFGVTEEELNNILGEDHIKELIISLTESYTDIIKLCSTGGMFGEDCFNNYGYTVAINTKDIYNYFDATMDSETGIMNFNKYNIENKTTLDLEDDAINANFSNYRIPTEADLLELFNNTNVYCIDKNNNEYNLKCSYDLENHLMWLSFVNADDHNIAGDNGIESIKFVGNNGNVLKFKNSYMLIPYDESSDSDFSITCLSLICNYGTDALESTLENFHYFLVPTSNLYLDYKEDETPSSNLSAFQFSLGIGMFIGHDRLKQYNPMPVSV